jgi:hypothetical protein
MRYYLTLLTCFFQLAVFFPSTAQCVEQEKTVLLAILARNKAHILDKYLSCIENLDYDKSLITLYINTNNNVDGTEQILEEWIAAHENEYRSVIYEAYDLKPFDSNLPHEWHGKRFKVLAEIRNKSLRVAQEVGADYYFVVDCDNFIRPYTLSYLIGKDKPIIAPFLEPIPEGGDRYSNYFCGINKYGYYQEHPEYFKIFSREKVGTFKVPVVHCTYLIKAEYLDQLSYSDSSSDYEFVIFSRIARNNKINQYICNEYDFGELIHFYDSPSLEEEAARMEEYFATFGFNY